MSWGGCLATGCLATLSGGCASLGRRLPAEEDCRATLVCFVTAVDGFKRLPTTDGGLTTTGLPFALDGLSSAAAALEDFGGAGGWITVGRTSLGFRDGLGSADGGFTTGRPVFALAAIPLPAVLLVTGWSAVLVLTLTTLGRRGSFLAAGGVASLTGPGAGSLAGLDGLLWSFFGSAGDDLRTVRAFVAILPRPVASTAGAPGVGLRGAEAWSGVGRVVTAVLVFTRTVNGLPVGLACLGAG